MADIISFEENPLAKLRRELKDKDDEIGRLRRELVEAKDKVASLVAVNEMLKLMLPDITSTLATFHQQIGHMVGNLTTLRGKLPNINSRTFGVRTQDRTDSPGPPDEPKAP